MTNKKFATLDEYKSAIESIPKDIDIDSIYDQSRSKLQQILDEQNYLEALKVINDKGLLNYTGLPAAFDWNQKRYIDFALRLLSTGDVSKKLASAFRKYIKID